MGAGSSVNQNREDRNIPQFYKDFPVTFTNDEFKDLVESFFDFYNTATNAVADLGNENTKTSRWNFDYFEIFPADVILPSVESIISTSIEQKIRAEYFRSLPTIHPLRVHQHLFEYISSGILGLDDCVEYKNLLSILNRHTHRIRSLVSATESLGFDLTCTFDIDYNDGMLEIQVPVEKIRLIGGKGKKSSKLVEGVEVEGNYKGEGKWNPGKIRKVRSHKNGRYASLSTIALTRSQEELLVSAVERFVGTFDKKREFLCHNSLPKKVQDFIMYSMDGHNFEEEASKILIAYYVIFRGKLVPVILNLKNEILDWARKFDSGRAHDDTAVTPTAPLPAPSAVMGVSLRFLKEFVASNAIPPEMITAKVVSDIVVPKTSSSKETFINAHLLSTPHFVNDLRKGYSKDKNVLTKGGNGFYSKLNGFNAFLSHAWAMPFLELVSIAENAAHVHFESQTELLLSICDSEDILDSSFFWIDVFCKNQHIPAPAMDEFHKALKASEVRGGHRAVPAAADRPAAHLVPV